MSSSRPLPISMIAAVCAGLACIGAFLMSASSASAVAPTELQIAFSETVDGNTDIYLRDPAGTRRTRRTQNPGEDFAPAWSPVGDQFAYVRLTPNGSRYHLRVQNVTTDRDTRLLSERFAFGRPAFTNDGTAVISATETGLLEVPVDNPGARRVIGDPADDSTDPAVDPTSSNLVVSRPRTGGRALAVIDDQGALLQWLTDGTSIDTLPAFSPDGADIHFARRAIGEPETKNQVYRIAADGSQQQVATQVTFPQEFNWATSPSPSPDGSELIFEAAQGGMGERMYVLQTADPDDIRFLALGVGPAWRPREWYYRDGATAVGSWIRSLQFTGNEAKGAIRIHQVEGFTDPQTGEGWYQVVPYRASLAVVGLLRAPDAASGGGADKFDVAEAWIDWYLDHLNTEVSVTDPDYGVVYDHWYKANGGGETTSPTGGAPYQDAADSYAATLLLAAWTYLDEGGDPDFFTASRMGDLRTVAQVIVDLQQQDGLTWARADEPGEIGRTKYLLDNAEAYAGLRAMASLERAVGSQDAAGDYDANANGVKDGIESELIDPFSPNVPLSGLYHLAKFESGIIGTTYRGGWFDIKPEDVPPYRATAHLVWPHLMGVTDGGSAAAQRQLAAVNAAFPTWSSAIVDENGMPWASVGYAAYLAGDEARAKEQAEFLLGREFAQLGSGGPDDPPTPTYPFVVDDAGWLLQTLGELQQADG